MKALSYAAAALFAAAGVAGVGASVGTAQEKTVATPLTGKMKDIDGKDMDLAQFKGKVVLVVNVASACGYTKQYKGLQDLYKQFGKEGLVVLGVPSNQFGGQEPGTEADIKEFCSSKYQVTFPMTAKVDVTGPNKVPLYQELTAATPEKGKTTEVGWNFEKFLIGRNGAVVGRFKSAVAPESDALQSAIRAALAKQ